MSEDNDSMSSGQGEMDTTGASQVLNDKSPGKMSNKSRDKQQPTKSGKGVTCNVYLLDGECVEFSLDKNDVGQALFDKVCSHLDLIEKDYFGFTYTDDRGPAHLKYWLNLDKKILKQKKRGAWVFDFALKFYPPDPTHLRESLTRWLVVLQVRRDLLSGRLPCTFTTYALLGSYNVQADIGEYDPVDHGNSFDYIKDMAFAPNQTPDLLEKIAELHKHHKGQTPDEAEKCFLDNAKKLSMYGVDLHNAKDSDNNALMLGVCASGLLIYRDKLRISRFVWPKILKLSYKRNHFYIKIRPREMERNDTTVMFKLDNHRLAKRLWKTCVEHHAFFRLRESEKPSHNPSFPRFGSKFRYSGRTLFQSRQSAALLDRPPPYFERSQPARNTYIEDDNRSKSEDELANRRNKDPYGNNIHDPNNYDRYNDGKDRKDLKGVNPATLEGYGNDDYQGEGDDSTLRKRPIDLDVSEDKRDRMPGHGDNTLERPGMEDPDAMGLTAGGLTHGKPETDKERRKREKEEDKRRRKELEDKRKKEEEERKKAEKERKKRGKGGLENTEDRADKMNDPNATETAIGVGAGSAGLHGGNLLRAPGEEDGSPGDKASDKTGDGNDKTADGHDKTGDGHKEGKWKPKKRGLFGSGRDKDKNKDKDNKVKQAADGTSWKKAGPDHAQSNSKDKKRIPPFAVMETMYVGRSPVKKANAGFPYGVGLGVGKGDLTGVVGDESSVEHKEHFLPIPVHVKETKDSLKGYTDNTMPFFHPAATSTVGRSKVPPPVAPKHKNSFDDSFNRSDYKTEKDGVEETRMVQKVTVSGDEDDYDYDSALADAIRAVTEFNPDMSVERIECVQQIEDVKGGK